MKDVFVANQSIGIGNTNQRIRGEEKKESAINKKYKSRTQTVLHVGYARSSLCNIRVNVPG